MKVTDLCGPIGAGTVEIRGGKHSIRALSANETALLRQAFPEPLPPSRLDKDRNPVADYDSPPHRAAVAKHFLQLMMLEVAAGLGLESSDGKTFQAGASTQDVAAWGRDIQAVMMSAMTDVEIINIHKRQQDIAGGVVTAAVKN